MGKRAHRIGLEAVVEDGLLGPQGRLGVVEARVPHRHLAGRGMNLRGLAGVEGGKMEVVRIFLAILIIKMEAKWPSFWDMSRVGVLNVNEIHQGINDLLTERVPAFGACSFLIFV